MKNKFLIKTISISTLVVLCFAVLFTYLQYDSYKISESKYIQINENLKKNLNLYIKSILIENKQKAQKSTQIYSDLIKDDLLKAYNKSEDDLKNDLLNPTPDSKLSKILDNRLDGVFINNNTKSNKLFVVSCNKVIWSRDMNIKNNCINNFVEEQYNKKLCEAAMHNIKKMNPQKNDLIFWEPTSNSINNHMMIDSISFDNLLAVYYKEGIDSLKSYEILIPVYITDNGDIFGTRDLNSVGTSNHNYKIIIIQRMNVYDAIKPYDENIVYLENQISNIEHDIYMNKKQRAANFFQSFIMILFILIISGYTQNKLYIENKKK